MELVAVPSGPSAALVRALQRADDYRGHTRAEATRAGYGGDWERFCAWARTAGTAPLPASPEVVSAHLGWLADEGYSVASIERFLAAGAHYHQAAGCDFPRGAPIVSKTLEGIRRKVGVARIKKAPLGINALVDICGRLQGPDTLRDRAMLTVGWFCMLRSANLVAIRREDVRLVRFEGADWIDDYEKPAGLILHLLGSKTDQRKVGRDIGAHAQANEIVCPVTALAAYFLERRFAPEDLIFPVNERTVSRLIKRLAADPDHSHKSMREIESCESCEMTVRRFASHSLRRGSATEQAKKGIAEREIMRQGGWKNERVMRGYIEHATLFENNPTKNLSGVAPAPLAAPPVLSAPPLAAPASPTRKRRRRLARASHGGWRRNKKRRNTKERNP